MPDTVSPRIVTVNLALSVPPDAEVPSGVELATYLAGLLSEADRREPGFFSLFDPVVFMEPVAVVVDLTGGSLQSAGAEIPLCVVGVDYGAGTEDCNCVIPDGDKAIDAEAHRIYAEVRPDWVGVVLGSVDAIDSEDGREAGSLELRPEGEFAHHMGDRGEIGLS